MSLAVITSIGAAILVFWALGAYNRLVRLQAQVSEALSDLIAAYRGQADMVETELAPVLGIASSSSQWMALDDSSARWRKAFLAAQQLRNCLSTLTTRANKLPVPDHIATVRAARDILQAAWNSAAIEHEDLAGAAAPATVVQRWQEHEQRLQVKQATHKACVQQYQSATTQFPALLISRLFGFTSTAAFIE